MAERPAPPQSTNVITAGFYRPLLPWQTRLIELFPGVPDSTLRCNVHLADVVADEGFGLPEASPPRCQTYEALSYSWGRPELTAQVECNSELVSVPPAMAEALNALRYADRSRWLWCDAISICQQDPVEKSHQVQMMQTIFRKAFQVVAWLGNEDEHSIRAFHVVASQSKASSLRRHEELRDAEMRGGASGLDTVDGSSNTDAVEALLQREQADIKAIEALSERSWFRRVWIRQEVFAATELVLQAGSRTTSFYDLEKFLAVHMDQIMSKDHLHVLIDHFRARYEPVTASELSRKLDEYKDSERHNFEGYIYHEEYHGVRVVMAAPDKVHRAAVFCDHFMKTIFEGKKFGASDDRDRIYALLGIINDSPTRSYLDEELQVQRLTPLPVDYDKSLSVVYQDVVKYLVNTSGRLDCLEIRKHYHATTGSPPFARAHGLPSWAIDWQIDEEMKVAKYERTFHRARPQDLSRVGELVLDGRLLGTLIDGELSDGTPENELHKACDFLGRPHRHEPENTTYVRRLFRTPVGSWAQAGVWVPAYCQEGDFLVIFQGSNCVYALRPDYGSRKCSMLGVCGMWIAEKFRSNLSRASVVELNWRYWLGPPKMGLVAANEMERPVQSRPDPPNLSSNTSNMWMRPWDKRRSAHNIDLPAPQEDEPDGWLDHLLGKLPESENGHTQLVPLEEYVLV